MKTLQDFGDKKLQLIADDYDLEESHKKRLLEIEKNFQEKKLALEKDAVQKSLTWKQWIEQNSPDAWVRQILTEPQTIKDLMAIETPIDPLTGIADTSALEKQIEFIHPFFSQEQMQQLIDFIMEFKDSANSTKRLLEETDQDLLEEQQAYLAKKKDLNARLLALEEELAASLQETSEDLQSSQNNLQETIGDFFTEEQRQNIRDTLQSPLFISSEQTAIGGFDNRYPTSRHSSGFLGFPLPPPSP